MSTALQSWVINSFLLKKIFDAKIIFEWKVEGNNKSSKIDVEYPSRYMLLWMRGICHSSYYPWIILSTSFFIGSESRFLANQWAVRIFTVERLLSLWIPKMASEKSKYFSIFGKRPASTENDDERKKKQKQYEQAKRSRSYQEEWSKKFPWHRKIRREDGVEVLICEPCKNQAKKRGN